MTKASLWQAVVATLILLVPLGWMAGSNELALRTDLSILLKPAVSTQGTFSVEITSSIVSRLFRGLIARNFRMEIVFTRY